MSASSHPHRRFALLPFALILLCLASWLAVSPAAGANSTPTFAPATNFNVGAQPSSVASGDFNRDGKLDLAAANAGSANVSILLGDGTGGFSSAGEFAAGANPVSIVAGDFNGDGKPDLATANLAANNVSLLSGDGAGGFSAPNNFAAGASPNYIAAADFNGDGKPDLITANSGAGNVSILLGDGAGGFGAAGNFAVGTNPHALAPADFNRDGKTDLAVANQGTNNVTVLLGNGAGGFGGGSNYNVGAQPASVAAGDFNGDNKPDIITANFDSNDVSVLLGDGAGGFGAASSYGVGLNPYALVVGDFYGDSKADVAVSNSGANSISILLGDGTGGLGAATNFAVGPEPRTLAAGDFNGDSKPDLAVPNAGSNNVSILINTSVVTAQVSGRVTGTQGDPIAGVTVEAINPANQQVVAATLTDANGSYALTVPLGTYTLKATPPSGSNLRTATIENLSVVGALVQDITLAPPDVFQLSGRIVDRDGLPVPHLEVILETSRDVTQSATRTANDGGYVMHAGRGTYFLRVRNNGPANEISNLPLVPNVPRAFDNGPFRDPNGADNISLTQDTVRNVTLPTRILSGTVRDPNGQPVVGAHLSSVRNYSYVSDLSTLNPVTFDAFAQQADGSLGTTDANGLYRMYVLPTNFNGSLSPILVEPPAGSGLPTQTVAGVEVQGDRTFDITLQGLVTLSGRIVDRDGQPIANLEVKLETSNSIVQAATRTANDGSYLLRVGPGTYFLHLLNNGAPNEISNLPLVANAPRFFSNDIRDPNGREDISLTQDTVRDITIPTRILSGTVRDSNGQPVVGVQLSTISNYSFAPSLQTINPVRFEGYSQKSDGSLGTTDANGFYRMYVLPTNFNGNLSPILVQPPAASGLSSQTISGVQIEGDRTLDITLQGLVTLSGRIVDRDGQPVPHLEVILETSTDVAQAATRTAADGSYLLRAGRGTYFLRVRNNGPANEISNLPLAPRVPRTFDSGPFRDPNGADNISLTQDTVRNVTLPTRILSGTVRDSRGQPVAGARLSSVQNYSYVSDLSTLNPVTFDAYSQQDDGRLAVTAADGSYRMYVLPTNFNGNLSPILVEPPTGSGLPTQTAAGIEIQGDRTLDITLQRPTRMIRGRVTDASGAPLTGVTVALSGAQSGISTTDGNGNYIFVNVSEGGTYTVTPARTSYSFEPPNTTFTNLLGDQVANFIGTAVTYTVSGHVTGVNNNGVGGVTVTLSGPGAAVTQTDPGGNYSFTNVAAFTNYTVKPAKPDFDFTPARRDITNLSSNQALDFAAAAQPSPTPTPPLNEDFSGTERDPDKFNLGSLSTTPVGFNPRVAVAQRNGHLEIQPLAGAFGAQYNGYAAVNAVDLTGRSASVEVMQAAAGAETIFSVGSDLNNNFSFVVRESTSPGAGKADGAGAREAEMLQLVFQIRVDGVLTALSIPYDPAQHRFWRFRHDPVASAIIFETSPEQTTWTARHSITLQKSVSALAVELSAGTVSPSVAPGQAVFDNFTLSTSYNIGGHVATAGGVPLSSVTLNLSGSRAGTTTTDAQGGYAFTTLPAGGSFTVTPARAGYTFTPPSQTFNALGRDQTADFTGALPAGSVATPAGANVEVQAGGVTLKFEQVTAAGVTTVTPLNPGAVGQLPSGYGLFDESVAFEIATTATVAGQINTCFNVPTITDAPIFNTLSVFHGEGGVLIERTAQRDFATKTVCASTNSLSPFVVAQKDTVQFIASGYQFDEGAGRATITVARTGDAAAVATVGYATVDDPAPVRCDTVNGTAYARCDYATASDTLRFAGGERRKSFTIPLIDDAHVEGAETVALRLSTPTAAPLGQQSTATLTIADNDTNSGMPNPAFNNPFFVRQQYLDFLSREPDAPGFNAWLSVLNNCADVNNLDPNAPSAGCDRILVSASFFGSQEFQLKGYFVYRFYKLAFNRLPAYTELTLDMRSVTGASAQEVFQKKAAYTSAFGTRQEFVSAYGNMTSAQYVAALLGRYNLTQITCPDPAAPDGAAKVTLTSAQLSAQLDSNTLTRAQILRAVADSDQVFQLEFNRAFVAMQYYGYLRRAPEAGGYNAWLNYLTAHPDDFRTMVNGFMNSVEYKLRFGQP
ncbi:MAG: carboxypeptidase regulatory-like domain-containing protein [Pyrinomonadaceae bacterium]